MRFNYLMILCCLALPLSAQDCCKFCNEGMQACGNSCIPAYYSCKKTQGCACDGKVSNSINSIANPTTTNTSENARSAILILENIIATATTGTTNTQAKVYLWLVEQALKDSGL